MDSIQSVKDDKAIIEKDQNPELDQLEKSISREPVKIYCSDFIDREISLDEQNLTVSANAQSKELYFYFAMGKYGMAGVAGLSFWFALATWNNEGIGVFFVFFIALGCLMLFVFSTLWKIKPNKKDYFVFDRGENTFFAGMKEESLNSADITETGKLADICAVQLLTKVVKNDDYVAVPGLELNMVFEDGNRTTILNHNNIEVMYEAAAIFEIFLNVPCWEHDLGLEELKRRLNKNYC